MAGQPGTVLAKLRRSPGARIVSGGVSPLDSGPELELLPGTITALHTVGKGGRNRIQRSSSWSPHSILLLLKHILLSFPNPIPRANLSPLRKPLLKPHCPAVPLPLTELFSFLH